MNESPPSKAVQNAVAHAIGRPPLEDEIIIRTAAPHQSNRLYDIRIENRHLIAKEFWRADLPDAARHECEALRFLESLQLAPVPVFFDPNVGPVVVYRYMEGEMWDRRMPSAAELRALAEAWLQFHCLSADGRVAAVSVRLHSEPAR